MCLAVPSGLGKRNARSGSMFSSWARSQVVRRLAKKSRVIIRSKWRLLSKGLLNSFEIRVQIDNDTQRILSLAEPRRPPRHPRKDRRGPPPAACCSTLVLLLSQLDNCILLFLVRGKMRWIKEDVWTEAINFLAVCIQVRSLQKSLLWFREITTWAIRLPFPKHKFGF